MFLWALACFWLFFSIYRALSLCHRFSDSQVKISMEVLHSRARLLCNIASAVNFHSFSTQALMKVTKARFLPERLYSTLHSLTLYLLVVLFHSIMWIQDYFDPNYFLPSFIIKITLIFYLI